jgi:hypothetical protein
VAKFRKKDYDDEEYFDKEYKDKKRKKDQRKSKYFDEYDSYEAHHRFNNKSQKFRTY